jgi:hypothetical protein
VNIYAIWAFYSVVSSPQPVADPALKMLWPAQGPSAALKEQKSTEADPDLKAADFLRITNEIARGS